MEKSVPPDSPFSPSGGPLISMDIKDEPLKEVLERISDENGITFVLPPSLGEETVMMRFSNLTLEDALSKILGPYNHIFIYREPKRPSKYPVARLEKVRIFPPEYAGRVREPLISIAEGVSETTGAPVPTQTESKNEKEVSVEASRGETYIDSMTATLQGRDPAAKLDAVKVLRDAGTVDAVRALSLALHDKNPRVKEEAVSALKALGEEIIHKAVPAVESTDTEDEPESSGSGNSTDNDTTKPPEQMGTAQLSEGSLSGDGRNFDLTNTVPVSSVQFKVRGGQPSEVRTTARTEGFFAKIDGKSGNVLLFHPSRETIPSGSGPILEVVGTNGNAMSLSGVIIADEKGNKIK